MRFNIHAVLLAPMDVREECGDTGSEEKHSEPGSGWHFDVGLVKVANGAFQAAHSVTTRHR